MSVAHDFPGGAVTSVRIHQEKREIHFLSNGWAWWYFKVSGCISGETIKLIYTKRGGPNHACFSIDGITWHVTPPGKRIMKPEIDGTTEQKAVEYTVRAEGSEFFFAMYVPYVLRDAVTEIRKAVDRCPHAHALDLGKSREGRIVPAVRIKEGNLPDKERPGIWVQARQHPWELSGSWAAAGFLRWVTSDDPAAAALRQRTEIIVAPMLNVDGVENGVTMTGAKSNPPPENDPEAHHFEPDLNRVWSHPRWISYHPQVKAARRQLAALHARTGGLAFFFDMHNYGFSGDEVLSFWYGHWKDPDRERQTAKKRNAFMRCIHDRITPPYDACPYDWNEIREDSTWITATESAALLSPSALCFILEFAFEQHGVSPVNPPEYMLDWGRTLGRALSDYLQ